MNLYEGRSEPTMREILDTVMAAGALKMVRKGA